MSEVRKRNASPGDAANPSQQATSDRASEPTTANGMSAFEVLLSFVQLLCVLVFLGGLACAGSQATTGTYFFGEDKRVFSFVNSKLATWRGPLQLTADELSQFDGSDPAKPIYLALLGEVFDVSAGESYYGKEGGYRFFSGRDASRSFVTGDFKNDLVPWVDDFDEKELKSLVDWAKFFKTHETYFYVGTVDNPPAPKGFYEQKAKEAEEKKQKAEEKRRQRKEAEASKKQKELEEKMVQAAADGHAKQQKEKEK